MLTYFTTPVRTLVLAVAFALFVAVRSATAGPSHTATARTRADAAPNIDGFPVDGLVIIAGIVVVGIVLAWVCSHFGDSR